MKLLVTKSKCFRKFLRRGVNQMNSQIEGKLVFSPMVAKYLLARNYTIIDIKPNKNNKEQTVFIFRNDNGLVDAIHDYKRRV